MQPCMTMPPGRRLRPHTAQRGGGRCGDLHRHYSTGLDGSGDVDRHVLARAAAVLHAVPAGALDEDLGAPPDPAWREASACCCVSSMRRSTRSRRTSGGTWSGQVGGGGAPARREHEGERRVERGLAHEVERLREVVLGLAGKAGDEVGGDADVGHGRAEGVDALQVLGGRVATPHRRRARGPSRPGPAGARARTRSAARRWRRRGRRRGPWGARS